MAEPNVTVNEAAQISQDGSLSEQYSFLLAGFVSERERLRSGVVTVVENISAERLGAASNAQSTLTFDFNQEKIRLNRDIGEKSTSYIRTPDFAASAAFANNELEGGVVEKTKPDVAPLRRFGYFDIHKVGLVTASQLLDNRHADLGLNQLVKMLAEQEVVSVEKDDNGLYVITTRIEKMGTERTMWIDANRGYSPTRFELRFAPKKGGKSTVLHNCETEWQQIQNIWVPVRFVDTGKNGLRAELTLSWSRINETPPDSIFAIEDIDVSSSSYAMYVDSRLDPPLIEKVIESDFPMPIAGGAWSFNRILFLILNAAVVITLVWFVLRRRRRTTI
jgi:hypothetical protein